MAGGGRIRRGRGHPRDPDPGQRQASGQGHRARRHHRRRAGGGDPVPGQGPGRARRQGAAPHHPRGRWQTRQHRRPLAGEGSRRKARPEEPLMTYEPAANRYDTMVYRACGRSGLRLPVMSLGLWHNFGDTAPLSAQRELVHAAFDLGITHFDLANNYGPPYGSAEINFGRILREDLAAHRDELLISSKAGWDMWPGPYGQGGGSRKHVLASLDQSLRRVGVEYFDILYSHRFCLDTPLEETAGALATAVRQGKALYVGISSHSAGKTLEMAALLREEGVPLLIHQPSYNLFNRWPEAELLDALEAVGSGMIAFTALGQRRERDHPASD